MENLSSTIFFPQRTSLSCKVGSFNNSVMASLISLACSYPRAAAVARKLLLTMLTPLTLASGAAMTWGWGAAVGLLYLAFLALATILLVELLVVDFCKVPFTCSLPPFRNDTLAVMLGPLLGFALFTVGGAQMASALYRAPLHLAVLATIVLFFWGAARYWLQESAIGATALQFTARQEAAVQTLDLTDRT